jgi:hypothetical protein
VSLKNRRARFEKNLEIQKQKIMDKKINELKKNMKEEFNKRYNQRLELHEKELHKKLNQVLR